MRIYLDNAATTQPDPRVLESMLPFFREQYGNPSALHHQGREAKAVLESARRTIAGLLNASPEEIIFTSGGTEADNIAIHSAVTGSGIDHVITTPFEHHAVLQTLKALQKKQLLTISYLKHDLNGNLDLDHLDYLLRTNTRNLVSVMHANNEVGNLNDIQHIAGRCTHYGALFHTDAVQSVGHHRYNLSELHVHFLAASAHKFHGPKGVGFLYCKKGTSLARLIHGGSQERSRRAGTENIPAIAGLARALELAYHQIDKQGRYIQNLKNMLISGIIQAIPQAYFNGNSAEADKSLPSVLSVGFPLPGNEHSLLKSLDDLQVSASGGSACAAGSASHVLSALGVNPNDETIRFSFSRMNTESEIESVIERLSAVCLALTDKSKAVMA